MSTYYCRSCAIALGHIDRSLLPSVNLTGDASGYQLYKYLKHTSTGYYYGGAVSLFSNPDYENYKTYVVGATISGCLEINDKNRKNLVFWAGQQIGCYYDPTSGAVVYPESGIRIALYQDEAKIHGFTCDPTGMLASCCACCGGPIPG
jgi:hypothetical protein